MARAPRQSVEQRDARLNRKLFARVLIVCEGRKTEPLYIRELVDELRVRTVEFRVVGEGRDPGAVVDQAIELVEHASGDFDYAFCVFDRDKHERYADACSRCAQKKLERQGGGVCELVAITSNPSFEYWLLLHLMPTTKPYRGVGNKSSGDIVLGDLKRELKKSFKLDYAKGMRGLYGVLRGKVDFAIKNAATANKTGLGNPHSLMGVFVECLRSVSAGGHPDISAIKRIPRQREEA